jgi:hypothetical protein
MRFKKRTEVRPASSSHSITMGNLIHVSYFRFSFSAGMLEEKEEARQKDREKIQELEQTLFELRGDIGAGRHVPPGVRMLSLSTNHALDWRDLLQVRLDRLEQNAALLDRLSAL